MSDMNAIKRKDAVEYFRWLDDLRESGTQNMFGARPLLAETFGLDRKMSSAVHAAWMKTFDPELSLEARVKKAVKP